MSPWTSSEDEVLINFVRFHEALFNTNSLLYRKFQMKQQLWCEIGAILNKTNTECSKRWGYVRDYYIRRRAKPGSAGESARKRAQLLSFLDDVSTSPKGSLKTQTVEHIAVVDVDIREIIQQDGNTDYKQETDDVSNDKYDAEQDSQSEHDTKMAEKDTSNTSHSCNKKLKHTSNSQEQRKRHYESQNTLPNELDETDLFFSSMAKIVKKFPSYDQAQIRMQIGLLVGNCELKYSSDRHNSR